MDFKLPPPKPVALKLKGEPNEACNFDEWLQDNSPFVMVWYETDKETMDALYALVKKKGVSIHAIMDRALKLRLEECRELLESAGYELPWDKLR